MKVLTESEYELVAKPALRNVFKENDPFSNAFASTIPVRKILYRFKYELDSLTCAALISAASSVGDSGCYFSLLGEQESGSWNPIELDACPKHCYIPFSIFPSIYMQKEHTDYSLISFFFVLEHVIYSPSGQWGIMFSHEGHCLLGCVSQFMEQFSSFIPDLDDQIEQFLEFWKSCKDNELPGLDLDWLPALLEGTYGQEIAYALLRQFKLP
jgi:hypothetical protein